MVLSDCSIIPYKGRVLTYFCRYVHLQSRRSTTSTLTRTLTESHMKHQNLTSTDSRPNQPLTLYASLHMEQYLVDMYWHSDNRPHFSSSNRLSRYFSMKNVNGVHGIVS